MADERKPEKAFLPALVGDVLGITYDLSNWKWNMDKRRWSMLVRELAKVEETGRVSMKEAEVLMGKLNYYSMLVPKGVRNRAFIKHIVAKKAWPGMTG